MIARYLPPDLSDEQLDAIVAQAIAQTGATSPRDMGAVMKVVMDQAGGLVDGKRASEAVRAALGRMTLVEESDADPDRTGQRRCRRAGGER